MMSEGQMQQRDSGATLIELLVAMSLVVILGGMSISAIVTSRDASESTRTTVRLNEEARLALNRLGRELRQAQEISRVSRDGSPTASAPVTAVAPTSGRSITLRVDFDGVYGIDPYAVDPEELTYTWDGSRLLLSAYDTSGVLNTSPVLAEQVTNFSMEFRSSRWEYDCNGDGKTVWTELDKHSSCAPASAKVGDNSGTLTATELKNIDSVVIDLTVLEGTKQQDYRLQIDLRNAQ